MKILNIKDGGLVAPEELTIHTVEQLRDDLVTAINDSNDTVKLSLSQMVHIDTAAVQVLLAAREFARNANRELVLADAGAEGQHTISRLGLREGLFGTMTEEPKP